MKVGDRVRERLRTATPLESRVGTIVEYYYYGWWWVRFDGEVFRHLKSEDALEVIDAKQEAQRDATALKEKLEVLQPLIDEMMKQEAQYKYNTTTIRDLANAAGFNLAEAHTEEQKPKRPSKKDMEKQAIADMPKAVQGDWDFTPVHWNVQALDTFLMLIGNCRG